MNRARETEIRRTWNISVGKELGSVSEVRAKLLAALPGVRGTVIGDDAGTSWPFVVHCSVRSRQEIQRILRAAGIKARAQSVRTT